MIIDQITIGICLNAVIILGGIYESIFGTTGRTYLISSSGIKFEFIEKISSEVSLIKDAKTGEHIQVFNKAFKIVTI